ncbi:hypothetical protein BAE44_0002412 [Dichanthelium oligosanthes]|uniref:F-box associated domain-containing protein n=1 Tax=Dichanthelium oligosanthes TaxID=888268 RepID=A0A1E5WHD9_9POAL|nr:hypothetical protein BAE44_0002412 [Dichanthelium oligosanthes]
MSRLLLVYSSEAGDWGLAIPYEGRAGALQEPCVVIGNTMYQLLLQHRTLSYDLESKSFSMIPLPPATQNKHIRTISLDGGVLGVVAVCGI